ncbi:hypothetical protein FE257_003005 [Aspergillus nanangensis]|uniref:Uncharacterized protein n=1 Tax=Aspergillus nanangensis TaxID=2582783 RepID=A0AAD4GNU9_ASPNN|nr:hypothetical protein FE257_003005 [Aspergillus nanangensis]
MSATFLYDSATERKISLPQALTPDLRTYWEIAKPLVTELCFQWSQYGESPNCTLEILFAYLQEMYRALLPPSEPLPRTANPTEFARMIDIYLSHTPGEGLDDLEFVMLRGNKRKLVGLEDTTQHRARTLDDYSCTPEELFYSIDSDGLPDILQHPGVNLCESATPPTDRSEESGQQGSPVTEVISSSRTSPHNSPHRRPSQTWDWVHSLHAQVDTEQITRNINKHLDHTGILLTLPPTPHCELSTTSTTGQTTRVHSPVTPALPEPADLVDHGNPENQCGGANQQGIRNEPSMSPILDNQDSCHQDTTTWASQDTERLSTSGLLEDLEQTMTNIPIQPTSDTPGCAPKVPLHSQLSGFQELRDTMALQFQGRSHIKLYDAVLTQANMEQWLNELQAPNEITKFTVDLISDQLSHQRHMQSIRILDVSWEQNIHRGSLRLSPIPKLLLLPVCMQGIWSLIELHADTGEVLHYLFHCDTDQEACHAEFLVCSQCQTATEALSYQLRSTGRSAPDWYFYYHHDYSTVAHGISFLWTLSQRAADQNVSLGPPRDFLLNLARDVIVEICREQRRFPASPGVGHVSRPEKARQRWISFKSPAGNPSDLLAMWDQVAKTPLAHRPMGWDQADRLMQLVFNIASPPVLVSIKRQLLHLRNKESIMATPFSRNPAGVFEAGLWHKTNEHASRVGLALTCWSVHHHRQQRQVEGCSDPIGQTVTDILSQLPESRRDYQHVEAKVRE